MHSLPLQRRLWIYCPGHARVSGNERADRLASTADITLILVNSLARGAPRLEELSDYGQVRKSPHWSPEGKRSGERKRSTFHPPRSRAICVQRDKYWHCFEGSLGETTERRDGPRMGLSEHNDAILSWNWRREGFGGGGEPERRVKILCQRTTVSVCCRVTYAEAW